MQNLIAQFYVHYYQYLTPNGVLTEDTPAEALLAPSQLIDLYQMMHLTRAFDKKAISLQRTGKIGTYASMLGQEAISCAIGSTLQKEDIFVPYYRDYTAQIMRGLPMEALLQYWGGDERGNDYRAHCKDLPIAVPIASQCLHAAGIAFAFQYRQVPQVVLTTCGDGATSKGDFYEALNIAGAWQLPIVFVINNNQWAISVARSAQTKAQTLAQKAIAAGFTGIQVDGNDMIALHYWLKHAIGQARNGHGPMLIEALTYRLSDHTTADDANRYRPLEELTKAQQLEPMVRLRHYLTQMNHWNDTQQQQLEAHTKTQIEQAVQAYLKKPLPSIDSIFDYMYANLPESLQQQKQQAHLDYPA